jgi:hypothetical protein
MRHTGKLCLWIVWDDRRYHKDTDWSPVVELAGYVMECFGDEHGGIEVFDVTSGGENSSTHVR